MAKQIELYKEEDKGERTYRKSIQKFLLQLAHNVG